MPLQPPCFLTPINLTCSISRSCPVHFRLGFAKSYQCLMVLDMLHQKIVYYLLASPHTNDLTPCLPYVDTARSPFIVKKVSITCQPSSTTSLIQQLYHLSLLPGIQSVSRCLVTYPNTPVLNIPLMRLSHLES